MVVNNSFSSRKYSLPTVNDNILYLFHDGKNTFCHVYKIIRIAVHYSLKALERKNTSEPYGSDVRVLVELRGFEPLTSTMRM